MQNTRLIFSGILILFLSAFLYAEGQYHFSVSHRQLISKPTERDNGNKIFDEPNDFGSFQTWIGVSGYDEYGYGNFELGQDWLANYTMGRFTLAFGQVVTFGPEIHGHHDNVNDAWGWGVGPTVNYNSRHFTITVGYPFDFNTCIYESSASNLDCPDGMISGVEIVLRGQLPAIDPEPRRKK